MNSCDDAGPAEGASVEVAGFRSADDNVRKDMQGVVRALDAAPDDDDVRGRNQRPRDDHQHPDVEQVGGVDGRRGVDGGVGGEDAVDCDVEPGGERGDGHVWLVVLHGGAGVPAGAGAGELEGVEGVEKQPTPL